MTEHPLRVVLGVDLLIRGLYHADEWAILELWRDGLLQPVVQPPLLRRYLAALGRLGLSAPVLRGWGAWLTSPESVLYLRGGEQGGEAATWAELYLDAARTGAAPVVVTAAPPPAGLPAEEAKAICWLTPAAFLRQMKP